MPKARDSKRTVAVVSDRKVFREGTAELLRRHGFNAVTEHGTPSQLMTAVKKPPDVVVVDLEHTRDDTRTVMRQIGSQLPNSRVVSIGSPVHQGAADAVPRVEVDSQSSGATLAAAVNARAPRASSELTRQHRLWAKVTPRQRDVLRWLSVGYDNAAIAEQLHVTPRAIKAHISALLELFGCGSRTQLALLGRNAGLLPPGRHH